MPLPEYDIKKDMDLLKEAVDVILDNYSPPITSVFTGPPQFIRDCYQIRQNLQSYDESKSKYGDLALYHQKFSRIKINELFKPEFKLILEKFAEKLHLNVDDLEHFFKEINKYGERNEEKKYSSLLVFLKATSINTQIITNFSYSYQHYKFLYLLCRNGPELFANACKIHEIYNNRNKAIPTPNIHKKYNSRFIYMSQYYYLKEYLHIKNEADNFLEFVETLIEKYPEMTLNQIYNLFDESIKNIGNDLFKLSLKHLKSLGEKFDLYLNLTHLVTDKLCINQIDKFLNLTIDKLSLNKSIETLESFEALRRKVYIDIPYTLGLIIDTKDHIEISSENFIVACNTISRIIPSGYTEFNLSNIIKLILTSEVNRQETPTFNDEEFRNFFSQVFKKFLNINKDEISTINKLIESGNLTDIKRLTLFLNFVEISATETARDGKSLKLLIDYFSNLDDSVVSSGVDSKKLLEYKKAFKKSNQNGDGILSIFTAIKLCNMNEIESIGRLRKEVIFKNSDTPEFSITIEEFLISMKQRIISEIQSSRDRFKDKNMDFFLNYMKTLEIINKILSVNDLTEVNNESRTTNDSALIDKMKNIYWYDRNLHFTKAVSRVFDGSVSDLENPHVQELNSLIYSGKKKKP